MKMSVTTLCVLLVVASSAQYGSATLHELAGFMPHTRVLRQASQSEVKRCSNVFLQEQCSTTSYAQDLINRLSQCGTIGSASISGVEGVCRKHPSTGDYCGSLVLDNGDALMAIPQSCTISTCSTACRTQLNSVINNAGCCATSNAVINVVLSPYLSSCNLTLPATCPDSSLRIPSSAGSCTFNEVLEVIFSFRCSRSTIQPILNALNSANCGDFASAVEADCSYRNGQYCYEQFLQTSTITTLTNAISQCSSSSNCSSGCRTEISTINNDLGCCINSFNASLRIDDSSNTLVPYRTITSNELWNACGETPPGECEVRLSAASSLCCSMSAILLLAFAVVMLFKF